MLNRWTTGEMQAMLREIGFSQITYASDEAYAGQSMIVCARK